MPKTYRADIANIAAFAALMIASASITACAAGFTAKQLAEEESKFAAYSVQHGMRAAFLEFFAEQSWLLRPEPLDAKTFLRARPDPAIVLDWKSQRTIMSASGDLGFSTGPWRLKSKADPKAPAAHGQFLSVWQKQKDGQWKVFIDHGISHGATTTPDALPTTPLIAVDLSVLKPGMPDADGEKDFIDRTRSRGVAMAYRDSVSSRSVLLREGEFPIVGKNAVATHLESQQGEWTWTPTMQGVSAAKDVMYVIGSYLWKPTAAEARKGQYVRVWVRDAGGEAPDRWTLAGEIVTPMPPPKP